MCSAVPVLLLLLTSPKQTNTDFPPWSPCRVSSAAPPRLSSQLVCCTSFLCHALSLPLPPPSHFLSYLHPASLCSSRERCVSQPTCGPTQSCSVSPAPLLSTPTRITRLGLLPYSLPLGCVTCKQIPTHVSLCRSCQHVMDRPPYEIQSLFSGTGRCRLHLHGSAPCLPADTQIQQRG